MRLIRSISEINKQLNEQRDKGRVIGFVPTMGCLHEGHLSLVRLAREKNRFVVVSIFVNPTQFAPHEDFMTYPRDLKRDLRLLRKERVDLVFHPLVRTLYPPGYKTSVVVEDLGKILCGVSRPGHFKGVATVVLKLFNIVKPDIAVFGQKDYQQTVVIRQMVRDLDLRVKILIGKTIRESDGLAMSSRNLYLSDRERHAAPVLYQSLSWAKNAFGRGNNDAPAIIGKVRRMIEKKGGRTDYVEVLDKNTLTRIRYLKKGSVIALAAYFGRTRLIDNIII
jgi:pantoate--beta-alanine ligase